MRISAEKVPVGQLMPVSERMSFVYLEQCVIHRASNALTVMSEQGTVHLPSAAIGVLLLGPGSKITHGAMGLASESGASVCWVGEDCIKFYGSAVSRGSSTRLLEAQARLVTHQQGHLEVARKMYGLRFPGEDVSRSTMQQLRGREGSRIRGVYKAESQRTGVPWSGRNYNPNNWGEGDAINKALSVTSSCLYGVVHTAIVGLGCSPGLGFVHTGHQNAFVHDIADLYKAEVAIPTAFEAIAEPGDVSNASLIRKKMRTAIRNHHVLERAVRDIHFLLGFGPAEENLNNVVHLWDPMHEVASGVSYGGTPQ